MLERRLYSERPARHEYLLTERGRDFRTVLVALLAFGDRHFAVGGGGGARVVDTATGAVAEPMLVDRRSGKELVEPHFTIVRGRRGVGRRRRSARAASGRHRPARRRRLRRRAAERAHEQPRRRTAGRSGRGAGRAAGRAGRGDEPAHPAPAAGRDRADPAADGLAEHPGDDGAGLDRPDRDLVGLEARHRRARRHGAGLPRLHDDADALGRRHRRRHRVGGGARARRQPPRRCRRAGAARPADQPRPGRRRPRRCS